MITLRALIARMRRPCSAVPVNKAAGELLYWVGRTEAEGTLANSHYEYFYTEHFALPARFFADKSILDVGCGPRGSLEWAGDARLRVGTDPLAVPYRGLGTRSHAMAYVAGNAECLPFRPATFDFVSSFNALNHVDALGLAIEETVRVLKPGGLLLLLTDVHRIPTPLEPTGLWWEVIDRLRGRMRVLKEEHFEREAGGLYDSVRRRVPFDHANPTERYGMLSALLRRNA